MRSLRPRVRARAAHHRGSDQDLPELQGAQGAAAHFQNVVRQPDARKDGSGKSDEKGKTEDKGDSKPSEKSKPSKSTPTKDKSAKGKSRPAA
jgi:hypothetical protein